MLRLGADEHESELRVGIARIFDHLMEIASHSHEFETGTWTQPVGDGCSVGRQISANRSQALTARPSAHWWSLKVERSGWISCRKNCGEGILAAENQAIRAIRNMGDQAASTDTCIMRVSHRSAGEMAEWLKAHAWKACLGETLTWVRIPLSPPSSLNCREFLPFIPLGIHQCRPFFAISARPTGLQRTDFVPATGTNLAFFSVRGDQQSDFQ